ncbi:serine hydrolase [candidate division GN15 bacterium]|nr:serine hydrolase [candidate division GN15 bacterium]
MSVALALLLLGVFLTPALPAQTLAERFDQYCRAANEINNFHGAVLVAKDGEVVFANGYGWASAQLGVENTAQHKFLIGSITKSFTAAAILRLAEAGKLTLEDKLSKYFDDFPAEVADKVTIHHLLTHTSGVHSYTEITDLMLRRTIAMTPEEIVDRFKNMPLDFEPGAEWKYSNSGYFLLGLIIEKASGMSYDEYLEEHILGPAGMEQTGLAVTEEIVDGMVQGYAVHEDELANAVVIHMSLPFAAGALYSTVADLYRWDRALYGEEILTEASKEKMFTPYKNDYGYGWAITKLYDRSLVTHSGGIDGFNSMMHRFVDDDVCVVVLSNATAGQASTVAASLAAILFDEPYDVPVKKEPIAADPSDWDDFTGVYRIDSNEYRVVTMEDDRLYSKRGSGPQFEIFPEADNKFFFEHDNAVTLTFVRDDAGEVVAHVIHQQGQDHRAEKLPEDEAAQVMAEMFPPEAEVDPAVYADYVGQYQIAPGFILTVRTRDDRIFTQATGQQEVEIFPSAPDEYFLKVVDAQITFVRGDDGEVESLILHQAGREMPAPKIE